MSFWNQSNHNSYWNKENVEGEVNIIKRREESKGKMRSPHFFPIMSFKGLFGQGTKTIYEGSSSSRQSLLWTFHSRRFYWQMPRFDIVCIVCVLGNLKKSLDSPVLSMIRFFPLNQSINFWKTGFFFFVFLVFFWYLLSYHLDFVRWLSHLFKWNPDFSLGLDLFFLHLSPSS